MDVQLGRNWETGALPRSHDGMGVTNVSGKTGTGVLI
jgi:hypothetical protein